LSFGGIGGQCLGSQVPVRGLVSMILGRSRTTQAPSELILQPSTMIFRSLERGKKKKPLPSSLAVCWLAAIVLGHLDLFCTIKS
jgi:hypothetical protein